MTALEFSINLPASAERLIKLATSYENFRNYLPDQIKSIKVIQSTDEETITEETLTFTSFLKTEIKQQSSHTRDNEKLNSKIISGPFKGSTVQVQFEGNDSGTKVKVVANLKIPLKYKIVSLVIKKSYKIFLTAILYKMNTEALNCHN